MYQIKTLAPKDGRAADWDNYVQQDSAGSFFHLSGWQQVLLHLGHQCYYLYAEQDGQLQGLLPLARVRSALFGDALVSTPFCVYGGAIGSEPAKRQLEQAAIELAERLKVDYLELRYQHPQQNELVTRSHHAYFSCPLAEDDAAILAGIKKKQRAVVRQSLNQQLSYTLQPDINSFFQTYSESVRNLGTPVLPKRYFQSLLQAFPHQTEILTVQHQGKPVSSVLSFYYKNQVLPYYGGGVSEARQLKSNDFMYYQLMCHARTDKQCDSYDFGRSKVDSGAYHYKRHWGMEPVELPYQYHLVKAEALPNLSPNNPKYQLFIKMWQKLPLSVSQILGPVLARSLG